MPLQLTIYFGCKSVFLTLRTARYLTFRGVADKASRRLTRGTSPNYSIRAQIIASAPALLAAFHDTQCAESGQCRRDGILNLPGRRRCGAARKRLSAIGGGRIRPDASPKMLVGELRAAHTILFTLSARTFAQSQIAAPGQEYRIPADTSIVKYRDSGLERLDDTIGLPRLSR